MKSHWSSLVVSCLSVLSLCCWTGESSWQTRGVSNNNSYSRINGTPLQVRGSDNEFELKEPESETNSNSSIDLHNEGSLCAYRVLDRGENGRLCFRHARVNFTCPGNTCRQVRSPGGHLVANLLSNSTVLLQWSYPMVQKKKSGYISSNSETLTQPPTGPLSDPPKIPSVGQRGPQGGFRMRCWWNGSYTQFECSSVHLASSCRDYFLSELHENVPYRICLQPVIWGGPGECVEFSVTPTGMQDIVIAMMMVGGAICVMLVIICLLVAYITENIMSPNAQHTLAAQQHSRRSHNTYL